MRRSVLDIAESLMSQRQFAKAITLLEGRADIYEDNFDYYLTLGTACLYVGDPGSATRYFQRARSIKMTDSRLLLGQAAIFLRRGDTDRAVRYYLDILDNDPNNKTASSALEFIRAKGDYDTICRWVDSGRIEQFYPPIGINKSRVAGITVLFVLILVGFLFVFNLTNKKPQVLGPRANLNAVVLSVEERKHTQETDLSGSVYRYILTDKQINASYDKAVQAFQTYNDNLAQLELNRIVNSNATFSIKQKAQIFMGYLKEPTFDTIQNSYTYEQVNSDIPLYLDCWVSWTGRISNATTIGKSFSCDLLVGYETMQTLKGVVPLFFENAPEPSVDGEKPVRVLAKVTLQDGKLCLLCKSVYQSVSGSLEIK